MAEYIERSAVLQNKTTMTEYDEGGWDAPVSVVRVTDIEAIPASDVEPVRHGRWIEEKNQTLLPVEFDDAGEPVLHDYVIYHCDQCGRMESEKEPYCHCGAKMDAEVSGNG